MLRPLVLLLVSAASNAIISYRRPAKTTSVIRHLVDELESNESIILRRFQVSFDERGLSKDFEHRCGHTSFFLQSITDKLSPWAREDFESRYHSARDPRLQHDMKTYWNRLRDGPFGWNFRRHLDTDIDNAYTQINNTKCLLGLESHASCGDSFRFTSNQFLVCVHIGGEVDHVFCILRDDSEYFVLQSFLKQYSLLNYLKGRIQPSSYHRWVKPLIRKPHQPLQAQQVLKFLDAVLELLTLPITGIQFVCRMSELFLGERLNLKTFDKVQRTARMYLTFNNVDEDAMRSALHHIKTIPEWSIHVGRHSLPIQTRTQYYRDEDDDFIGVMSL
jgi:hypothetical protein